MWVKQYTAKKNISKIQDRFEEITQTKRMIVYFHHSLDSNSDERELRRDTILWDVGEKCFRFEEKCEFSDSKKVSHVPKNIKQVYN